MLGDILIEEKGQTTGVRVLSSESGEIKVEVDLRTEGTIRGVSEVSVWTYWSKTRSDGTVYGEGEGFMTTQDGDVINMKGNGAAKSMGADGSVHYRGSIFFTTTSEKYKDLNGAVAVHEYDVDGDGNTAAKIWEWK